MERSPAKLNNEKPSIANSDLLSGRRAPGRVTADGPTPAKIIEEVKKDKYTCSPNDENASTSQIYNV